MASAKRTRGFRIGLIVNPIAGVGGPAGLKGSDGRATQRAAIERGGRLNATQRVARTLRHVKALEGMSFVTWGGAMGEAVLRALGIEGDVLGTATGEVTSARDTQVAARAMLDAGVDLVLFGGGDGTARDLYEVLGKRVPVLGIPCGVKMHSGVFATRPQAAFEVLRRLAEGGLVRVAPADVRDVDEAALREGRLAARYFGEMKVPAVGEYLQHVKEGGVEREDLVVEEIVADVLERMEGASGVVLFGPGSTVASIQSRLGMTPTLLGVDALQGGRVVGTDLSERELLCLMCDDPTLVISFTRGQGALLGRGNQQLSAAVLRCIARDRIWVVGTRTKLGSLDGRPLFVDTGDPEMDARLSGLIEITAGYEDRLLYRVSD